MFARSLAESGQSLAAAVQRLLERTTGNGSERSLYALYQQATDFETRLDDHGAKRNATFHGLREATARLRWLSLAASAFAHLEARLPTYAAPDPEALQADLGQHVEGLVRRIGQILARSSEAFIQQWIASVGPWDPGAPLSVGPPAPRRMLPADRHQGGEAAEDESQAARFVGRFLRLAGGWSAEARIPRRGLGELTEYMERYCTEPSARVMESRAHNVQSEYDTHLARSPEVLEYPGLTMLRGGVSQCFHLLEAVTALTHLYERHWLHEKDRAYRESFSAMVPLEEYLDLLVNGCVVRAQRCLQDLLPEAEALLQTLAKPQERALRLPSGVTLHARPLSLIVAVVNHHKTPVYMRIGRDSANAASIMSLLILSGSHTDTHEVVFQGAEEVLDDLELLFSAGLGEKGLDALPPRLRLYLHH